LNKAVTSKAKYKTRQAYLDAALALIHSEGPAKLSMRKVANHMGVSPMAVYKHFANKDELMAAALDAFIARSDVYPADELPWDEWVQHLARGMYRALAGEVNWISALGGIRYGEQALRVTDSFKTKLISAGFTPRDTLQAYMAMTQLVVGAASIRASVALDGETRVGLMGSYIQQLLNSDSPSDRDMAEELMLSAQTPLVDIGIPMLIEAMRLKTGDRPRLTPDDASLATAQ